MTRVVVATDLHVDAGGSLGEPSAEWGSTRLLDAKTALERLAAEPCDVLLLGGDLFAGPAPDPPAVSLVQEAIAASSAKRIVLALGNHDATGQARTVLDVVAGGDPRCVVCVEPILVDCGDVQIAVLPWTPPQRLYGPEVERKDAHRAAADALLDIARGLGGHVDPKAPAILFAHWFLSGSRLPSDSDVITAAEPVLDAVELEASGPWSVCLAGHNHRRQQTGAGCSWVIGPLMRSGFGEADLETGYAIVDVDQPGERASVSFSEPVDRPLVTVRLDVPALLAGDPLALPDVDAAVVRLTGEATPDQARQVGDLAAQLVDECVLAGAVKVIGPQLDVQRERTQRSDVTVDTDPAAALDDWLAGQDLDEDLVQAAREIGAAIIDGDRQAVTA